MFACGHTTILVFQFTCIFAVVVVEILDLSVLYLCGCLLHPVQNRFKKLDWSLKEIKHLTARGAQLFQECTRAFEITMKTALREQNLFIYHLRSWISIRNNPVSMLHFCLLLHVCNQAIIWCRAPVLPLFLTYMQHIPVMFSSGQDAPMSLSVRFRFRELTSRGKM